MAANEDWRSPAFRQKVISQIEEAVKRSGNPNVMMKNPGEMESQVYSKAKTRVDYLAYVARLLVYIRDIRPSSVLPGQQQAPIANMSQQPGMRPQFPPPQINKQQTVSAIGGQGTIQQVQLPQVQPSQLASQQVFYDRSGLTQQQILAQHLQHQQQRAQQQQQQQQHQLPTPSLLTPQVLSVASQNQGGHHPMTQSQAHIPPVQVASPMHQVQQAKHTVQVRMPHVSSPAAGPPMSSNSMRAPTPSSGQHSSLTSQATVAPSPAPLFVPSPAMHPSPSPQHYIAASPAACTSVPTPSTMSVQSPASVPNPASVGAPAASPAALNPADEQAYLDKLNELKPYVEPLTRMINKMNRDMRDKEHSRDLYKLKHLYDILTNPAKRLPLQALENSGNVLKKLINIKPHSVPTPPAPPTPGNTTSSIATTSSITTSTTTTCPPIIQPAPMSTLPQAIYKPLYDAVTKHAKSPMLSHTLQRTFSPLLQAMEGPPILPLPPPAKRIKLADNSQKKCTVPHVLQGELARLCSRFQVKSGASTGVIQSNTLLQCSINDLNLPAVPPIEISVPQNYPYSSPECKTANYNADPFLQKVQKQLSSRLQRMPEMYSVTSVLNAWESSIRQACNAEVTVN